LHKKSFVLAVTCLSIVSLAHATVIDFEDLNFPNTFLHVGPTLTYANAGGSGVDVSFVEQDLLRACNLDQFGGADWTGPGHVALIDMNTQTFNNPKGAVILFSQAVSNFSLDAGDFGADDDGNLQIEAFDVNNASLGTFSSSWAGNNAPFAHLGLNVGGIRKVVYTSGGAFKNSTFYDNISFTAVPEPFSLAALVLGCSAVVRRRRRI